MNEIWQIELRAATSISSFVSNSTAPFRTELRRCLAASVSKCKLLDGEQGNCCHINKAFHRYNPQLFSRELCQSIDWNSLIRNHNLVFTNSTGNKHGSTAFKELMDLLFDPRVIPFALSSSLLRVFVWTFMSQSSGVSRREQRMRQDDSGPTEGPSSSSRWSPSQSLLLQAIKRLIMTTRQCRDELREMILSVVQEHPSSLAVSRSALSLIKYFTKEVEGLRRDFCPVASLFPCLLGLLQQVMIEKGQLATSGAATKDESICGICKRCIDTPSRRRRRRPTQVDLTTLHDEWQGGDNNFPPQPQSYGDRKHFRSNHSQRSVLSLNSIVQDRGGNDDLMMSCPHCQSPIHNQSHPTTPFATIQDWCFHADKCLHLSLAWISLLSKERAFGVLRVSLKHYDDALIRLCVLQFAEMGGGRDYYGYLLYLLWTLAWEQHPKYLTWYAEVIVESSFCDDRASAWEAMQPLVSSVLSRCSGGGEEVEDHENEGEESDSRLMILLPCLGYILSRRRRLFQTVRDSIYQEFSSLVTELSLSFSDAKRWISHYPDRSASWDTEQKILEALQNLGILSVSSVLWEGEKPPVKDFRKPHAQCWENPKPQVLNRAYQRMVWSPLGASKLNPSLRYTINPTLLSDLHHDLGEVPVSADVAERPTGMDTRSSTPPPPPPPIMSHLNQDIFRYIFAFLGYKKLVRIRCVSTAWRYLADEDKLWHQHHARRFGILDDGCCTQSTTNEDSWKRRFVSKWVATRDIRFKCNQEKQFKYRLCGYVGCYQVLKSLKAVQTHQALHAKRALKKQERERKRLEAVQVRQALQERRAFKKQERERKRKANESCARARKTRRRSEKKAKSKRPTIVSDSS